MTIFSRFFRMFFLISMLSSCTYNVSMAHTEGSAVDVIDDTASNTPNVSPTISLPTI